MARPSFLEPVSCAATDPIEEEGKLRTAGHCDATADVGKWRDCLHGCTIFEESLLAGNTSAKLSGLRTAGLHHDPAQKLFMR
jgi:hypothetical protein